MSYAAMRLFQKAARGVQTQMSGQTMEEVLASFSPLAQYQLAKGMPGSPLTFIDYLRELARGRGGIDSDWRDYFSADLCHIRIIASSLSKESEMTSWEKGFAEKSMIQRIASVTGLENAAVQPYFRVAKV